MTTLLRQLKRNHAPGPHHVAPTPGRASPPQAIRLIAFYLPQFHPVPENDAWWGPGFTEWTNVSKALPLFDGHYQPHLPADLGFYDLRLPASLRAQAELARSYGVAGFCFHYYWFSGRRILDAPLENLLRDPTIDIGFCLNWANENWTRTWNGGEHDVLLRQGYEPGFEASLVDAIAPALADPRYIRIGNRPVFMIYRPSLLPEAAATADRLRALIAGRGLGEPFLMMAQLGDEASPSFDPRRYRLDAAVEFPPHRVGFDLPALAEPVARFDMTFRGGLRRYEDMVQRACMVARPDFPLFRGVCPGWDNTPRRPQRGFAFLDATPGAYGTWLEHACRDAGTTEDASARMVFINAWNEWAEGAHLEPDRHFGHGFLAETARVLRACAEGPGAEQAGYSAPESRAGLRRRLRVKGIETLRHLSERLAGEAGAR